MPRALLTSPRSVASVPDVPNYAWVEYGLRAGLPRLLRLFANRGIPVSAAMNATVVEAYPQAAEAILAGGLELIGHGVSQVPLQQVDDERAAIVEALDRIEAFAGVRPRGWLGPGLQETHATPDVLREVGIDHTFDWTVDDLPSWASTTSGPLLAVPYSLEFNDSVLHAVEHYPSRELLTRVTDTLAVFDTELADNPKLLTVPLHPHLYGVPHRVGYVASVLDLLLARPDTVFVTGTTVADWYAGVAPSPSKGDRPS